jgi:PAS domain S-box-containing protein
MRDMSGPARPDAPQPSQAALAHAELFHAAFEFAPIGMVLLGLDSRALRVNHAFCQMLGRAQHEIIGADPHIVVDAQDIAEDFRLRELMLAGAFPSYQREKRYLHKSGRALWVQVSCSLVHDLYGHPLLFLVQAQDVTALRESREALEDRIRRRTVELEESNLQLRSFAYSLAHDLRAPLASTDGFARQLELLLGERLDERARHYLNRVRAGVQSISELMDALLSLANLSHEPLQHGRVDLSAVARAWLDRAREREPQRDAAVEIADTPPVQGDPRLLTMLLGHLLDNAWKFTSKRADAQIAFRAEPDEAGLRFIVADNGAGFDPAYADKLFRPFQRLHTVREFSGNGIGLAIVHRIAQRHGGRVWAEAQPDEGATFRFTLGGSA